MGDLKFYTATVPFDVAVELKQAGYWEPRCTYETSYNGPCYFIPGKRYYAEGVIAPWDELVPAPTYADVIDWFFNKEIILCIDYESLNPLTWTWCIQCIGNRRNDAKTSGYTGLTITEEQFDSFSNCANSGIKAVVSYFFQDKL